MVKIITIVKDEADIVRDWVVYHAAIVGPKNILVLDNKSTDGTLDILVAMRVPFLSVDDYKKKGEYMTDFLRRHPNELVIPMDIDEFLVGYNRATNTISTENLLQKLVSLPVVPVYKMPYVQARCTRECSRATLQCERGAFDERGGFDKTFFHTRIFKGVVDHGNHYPTEQYFKAPFALVHYHHRNMEQMKLKVKNNCAGLGHNLENLDELRALAKARGCNGWHHVQNWVDMQEGTYTFPLLTDGNVDLSPMRFKMVALTTRPGVLGVVSRYNEDLEWMLEPPFNQIKYLVYNKGSDENFCKANVVRVIPLPNLGRCDHTYLYHMVTHYHQIDKVVVFLPGSIDISYKKVKAAAIITHAVTKLRPSVVVTCRENVRESYKNFTLDEWTCVHHKNQQLNSSSKLIPAPIRPFGAWYDYHFGNCLTMYMGLHGIFSVSPETVAGRSIEEYKSLLKETSVGDNVEVGHYLERAWGAVLRSRLDFL